jgi:polyisoprenoid-binding protein YceI
LLPSGPASAADRPDTTVQQENHVTATTALALPTGTYMLDVHHSSVHFQVRHLGLANVHGTFKSFTASLAIGETLADVIVDASIDLASIDTGQPDRDAHLLSTDFFDAARNPAMAFRSTSITQVGGDLYDLTGDLTINGHTRPATFRTEFNGTEVFPVDQSVHVGFTATGEVRRGDFGIDFNMPLGVNKLAVGDKVKVQLDIQFIAPAAAR